MIMKESRKEIAADKILNRTHNCTQAILSTYHDYTGLEEETLVHAGNSFGAGMGNMEGTCGAIVGAGIVYGLAVKNKAKAMSGMRQLMNKFQLRNCATQCKLIKGIETGKVLRPCHLCVSDAAEFLEELLDNE